MSLSRLSRSWRRSVVGQSRQMSRLSRLSRLSREGTAGLPLWEVLRRSFRRPERRLPALVKPTPAMMLVFQPLPTTDTG
jgi:hypothetical protein